MGLYLSDMHCWEVAIFTCVHFHSHVKHVLSTHSTHTLQKPRA